MVDKSNPWTFEGWNLTAQSTYVREKGMVRAQARASDAGTTVGGPKPPPATMVLQVGQRKYAEVAVVRPANPPIYRFMIPAKREEDVRVIDTGEDRSVDVGPGDSRGVGRTS
jgi:hypothetical protein